MSGKQSRDVMLCIRSGQVMAMVVISDDNTYRDIIMEWAVDPATEAIIRVPVETARKVFMGPAFALTAELLEAAPPTPQPNVKGIEEGIERAARYIEKQRDDYVLEFGNYDPSTGVTEFSTAGEEYLSTLEELIEGIRALHEQVPAPQPNVEAPKTRVSPNTGWSMPVFNDRVIREGFPDGWFIQDRLDTNEALLCSPAFPFGSQCICLRPRAISTDEWLPMARRIANALHSALATAAEGSEG